ncbi:MAG: FAD-dependent oxidoreductase, partial [Eubacteriales bacterium]|nr:FAD-dependent oxidoreductase [Eubacteriales bacterium]
TEVKNGKVTLADETSIPVAGEYDVVVTGGGVAGSAAAMAAGKRGWKTLIIEATSALGGLATMGLVNIPLDFVSGLGKEMFDELTAVEGLWHRNSDPEKHKLVLDRMIKKYNCDVLLVTQVVDSIMERDTIKGVVIQTKKGRKAVLAKRVIDCSGDSDAAYYAGAELMQGRPGDGMSQACSLEFVLGSVDWDKYTASDIKKNDPKWLEVIKKALASGDLPYEVDNHLNWMTHIPGRPQHCGKDEVSICFAHSRNCYPGDTTDLTRMYIEGREQVDFISKFIKKHIPGFEDSYLSYTGSLLGVRESRRITGRYVLSAEDIAGLRKFDDVICISSHGYDVHNYDGPGNIKWAEMKINGKTEYVICNPMGYATTTPPPGGRTLVNIKGQNVDEAEFELNGYYDIPYRCLVPVRIENLLAAGRNLSSDVNAQSGSRLIMACLTMGEAAGTAAAISLKLDIDPGKVDRIGLQEELIRNGVNLGQVYRKIPGIDEAALKSAEAKHDTYSNPEKVMSADRIKEFKRQAGVLKKIADEWKK